MTFRPELVGSFSEGASGNPTPALMVAAFADLNLEWQYVNCEVPRAALGAAVDGAEAMGWRGFNCSMPHKQAVIPLLSSLAPTAEITQSVNCVCSSADGWIGHNTDGAGFVEAVRDAVHFREQHVMMLGSGGAASAIAVELALAGVESMTILSRNSEAAARLAALVAPLMDGPVDTGDLSRITPGSNPTLLINATPVGSSSLKDQRLPVDWPENTRRLIACDVVVDPPTTTFLKEAASAGAPAINGSSMLVNQAAENVRLWTGNRPNLDSMRAALDGALGRAAQ